MRTVKRGDIFYADLDPVQGSEQGGLRPVVIIQNDKGNKYSPTTIAVALTSNVHKNFLPTHVRTDNWAGLPKDSVILAEQVRTIDKSRLRDKIGHLSPRMMEEVEQALTVSIGLDDRYNT
jgi:mRNA interferase MazF